MKSILALHTRTDSTRREALTLKNYLRGKLRALADVIDMGDILIEERDFIKVLRRSDCLLLIVSPHASHLLQNNQQETEGKYITFDGKLIRDELAQNKELVKDKLAIVFFEERTESDWIPEGMDHNRIFDLKEKIRGGTRTPILAHLEYTIRGILGQTFVDW